MFGLVWVFVWLLLGFCWVFARFFLFCSVVDEFCLVFVWFLFHVCLIFARFLVFFLMSVCFVLLGFCLVFAWCLTENVSPEANREKTTMKLKHINFESILEPFWPHLGVLGRALESSLGVLEPT